MIRNSERKIHMKNSFVRFIIYGIIGLAVLGLIMQLVNNTSNFLFSTLTSIIFGLAIFGLLYYFVLGRRNNSSDDKKYKQAVKQSHSKYATHKSAPKNRSQTKISPIKRKKRPNHLRVIDGNKTKSKNRA